MIGGSLRSARGAMDDRFVWRAESCWRWRAWLLGGRGKMVWCCGGEISSQPPVNPSKCGGLRAVLPGGSVVLAVRVARAAAGAAAGAAAAGGAAEML